MSHYTTINPLMVCAINMLINITHLLNNNALSGSVNNRTTNTKPIDHEKVTPKYTIISKLQIE